MSNEETSLARQVTIIAPRTLEEVSTLSERISKSGLLPEALRGKVPEVMMQIMAGQELGLAPMASLRSFSIIGGKPVMSADAMVAVVLGSGKCEYFHRVGEGTDKSVTYATKRRGREEQRCTWSIEMAKTAALNMKDNWRTFPRAMLASRAKSELARDVYSDILAGIFTAEEMERSSPSVVSEQIDDAEIVEARWSEHPKAMANTVAKGRAIDTIIGEAAQQMFEPSDYPEISEIESATTIEACREVAGRFAKRGLKPGHPAYEAINVRYKSQVAALKVRASGSADATSSGSAPPSDASTVGEAP